MTPEQFAEFTILNDLNFYGGIFLGLAIGQFFKVLITSIHRGFERPRRIKLAKLQGKAENKTNFEYLYLFKNEYYTLEQRDFLIKQRLKDIKSISKVSYSFLFLIFGTILFTLLFIALINVIGFSL